MKLPGLHVGGPLSLKKVDNDRSAPLLLAMTSAGGRSPDDACLISRLWLGWCAAIAYRGWSKPLHEEDLPSAPRGVRSEPLHRVAVELWEAELARAEPGKAQVLSGVLYPLARRSFYQGGALLVVSGLCNSVARPLLLKSAVESISPDEPLWRGFAFAGGLGACLLLEQWSKTQGLHIAGDEAILRASSAAMQLVTLKAGRLRTGVGSDGAEQTLLGKDLVGAADMARFLPLMWLCLSSLVGGLTVVFVLSGLAGGLGVLVMAGTFFVSIPLGRRAKRSQARRRGARRRGHPPPTPPFPSGGDAQGVGGDGGRDEGAARWRKGGQVHGLGGDVPRPHLPPPRDRADAPPHIPHRDQRRRADRARLAHHLHPLHRPRPRAHFARPLPRRCRAANHLPLPGWAGPFPHVLAHALAAPWPRLGHTSPRPRPHLAHALAPRSRRSSRRCACPSSCCRWSSRS